MGILESLSDDQGRMLIIQILSATTSFTTEEIKKALLKKDPNLKLDKLLRAVVKTPIPATKARTIKLGILAGHLGAQIIEDKEISHLILTDLEVDDMALLLIIFWYANKKKLRSCFLAGEPLIN